MICGFCAFGSSYGAKERAVFEFLAQADWRITQLVRDQAIGCGSRRRPDGYVVLSARIETDSGDAVCVLFIIEVDENQHRHIEPGCELKRLEEIQERHGGPVFVLRYNPDQPGGLDQPQLEALAARCIEILDGDYVLAMDAFGGLVVEHHGYTAQRVTRVERAWYESQVIESQVM